MRRLMGDRPRKTLGELFRQFRVPLALAIVWTAFKIWEAAPTNSVSSVLAIILSQFSAAFFLLSWAWGQYNRVDRQQDTTERLQAIQSSLTESQQVTARLAEVQKQQHAIFTKLARLDLGDPAFRPTVLEASRLAVESSALSTQANTAALTALNLTIAPPSLGSPPMVTLPSDSPKPER